MTPTDAHLAFALPPGWQTRTQPGAGVLARARPHDPQGRPRGGVPPEIVVRTHPVDGELVTWRCEAVTALAAQLDGFELEDQDLYRLGPHRVHYHRFGHRLGTTELISDQWAWLVDRLRDGIREGMGVTLTCTVPREDYPAYCDLFEDVAASVDLVTPSTTADRR